MAELSSFFSILVILKQIFYLYTQIDVPLEFCVHWKPFYIVHWDEHPSPLTLFLSSHWCLNLIPSPHIYSHVSLFSWYPVLQTQFPLESITKLSIIEQKMQWEFASMAAIDEQPIPS